MIGIQCTSSGNGYDLLIKGGKLSIGETTLQNQALLLIGHRGDFKEVPLMGIGLPDIALDHDFASWRRSITEQLENDGQRIKKLKIDSNGLTLEAEYKAK